VQNCRSAEAVVQMCRGAGFGAGVVGAGSEVQRRCSRAVAVVHGLECRTADAEVQRCRHMCRGAVKQRCRGAGAGAGAEVQWCRVQRCSVVQWCSGAVVVNICSNQYSFKSALFVAATLERP
jgi:hypothetical protein